MAKVIDKTRLVKGVIDPSMVSSDVTIGTSDVISGTQGSVLFVGASTKLQQDNANFFWDDTNNRLGLGINSSIGARLALKSAGATSTDITQRWIASASSTDLFSVTGDGVFNINNGGSIKSASGLNSITESYYSAGGFKLISITDGTAYANLTITGASSPNFNIDLADTAGSTASSHLTEDGWSQSFSEVAGGNTMTNSASVFGLTSTFIIADSSGYGVAMYGTGGASGENWNWTIGDATHNNSVTLLSSISTYLNPIKVTIGTNGTPSTDTNSFSLYSADISAGNACMHTIAEGGQVYYMGSQFGLRSNHSLIFTTNNTDIGRYDTSGNFIVGGSTVGTSAAKSITIFTGTAPTTSVTDGTAIYSDDITAGNATLHVRAEGGQIYYFGSLFGTRSNTDLVFASNNADVGRFTRTSGNLLIGGSTSPTSATKSIGITTGTAPTGSLTDGSIIYSADQAIGNACIHARSENGGIVKLFTGAALTAQETTITFSEPGTPDYAIQGVTAVGPFGFVTANEGNTFIGVVENLQVRVAQLEARLQANGLVT